MIHYVAYFDRQTCVFAGLRVVAAEPMMLGRAEPQPKLPGNVARYFLLQGHGVGKLLAVLLTPEFGAGRNIDHIGGNIDASIAFYQLALDDRFDSQLASNLAGIHVLALVMKNRTASQDAQLRQL